LKVGSSVSCCSGEVLDEGRDPGRVQRLSEALEDCMYLYCDCMFLLSRHALTPLGDAMWRRSEIVVAATATRRGSEATRSSDAGAWTLKHLHRESEPGTRENGMYIPGSWNPVVIGRRRLCDGNRLAVAPCASPRTPGRLRTRS
jgi:hypothetical protein